MRVGVQTAGWYHDTDPDGSIAYIKSCGFDSIDFNINHYISVGELVKNEGEPHSFFDQDIEALYAFFAPLKAACEKHDVAISQMHAPFPTWVEGRDDINEHLMMACEKCLLISKFLNCPAAVVHPVSRPNKSEEPAINYAMYRRLMPTAVKTGVVVCLENMFTRRPLRILEGCCADVREVCEYIDTLNAEAGCRAFGFCLDIGHANLVGRKHREFIRALGDRLTVLHLNDNNGLEDQHTIPYSCLTKGDDTAIDWPGVVEGLADIGYKGDLAFETFRIFNVFPKAVHREVLHLIAAIGHCWAQEIEKE